MKIVSNDVYRDPRDGSVVEVLKHDDYVVKIRHHGGMVEYVKRIEFVIRFMRVYQRYSKVVAK